jgi:membrane fusion protein, multidrug efflux system
MTDRISNISDLDARGQRLPQPDLDRDLAGDPSLEPIQLDANSALTAIEPPHSPAETAELPAAGAGRRWGKTAVLFGAILGIGALGFVGIRNLSSQTATKDKSADKKLKVTPVLVATAIQKTVPVQIQAIGTVQSGLSVSVTPQVSGRINGVFFNWSLD